MNNFEEIKKHQKLYWIIGALLFVFTVITVWASYWEVGAGLALFLALVIASVKGGLVANYFMHLNHEKKLIYFVLVLTVAFFVVLMAIPIFTFENNAGELSPLINQNTENVH